MALLTAEDVLNKAFSKTKYREGFDQDEVDDFLDEVAHTITSLTAERDDLAQRLAQAQAGQPVTPAVAAAEAAPESTEGGLLAAATDPSAPSATGMLALAQKLHDDYVRAGEDERDRLVDEAKTKAEGIVEQAETDARARLDELSSERTELEGKIDDLRRFERDYRSRLKSYLENLIGDLDHSAGSESPSAPSASTGVVADSGFSGGFGVVEEPEVEPTAEEETPEEAEDERPAAEPSPWAQARPQAVPAEPVVEEPAAEQPAPWGTSRYTPRVEAPQSDVASQYGPSDDDSQR